MPVYLLAYHGRSIPKTEAENPELMTAWLDWMDQLGDALEGNINPMMATRTIHPGGAVSHDGGANPSWASASSRPMTSTLLFRWPKPARISALAARSKSPSCSR